MKESDFHKTVVAIYGTTDSQKSVGTIIGTGILITDKHVLTCAHVVAEALGISPSIKQAPDPNKRVTLEIGVIENKKEQRFAKVESDQFWVPVKRSGADQEIEDIAILTLDEPLNLDAPLRWAKEKTSCKFKFCGFGGDKKIQARGEWVDGTYSGPTRDWDLLKTTEKEDWSGFSGSGIFDKDNSRLLGMVVAGRTDRKKIYMIHARLIYDHFSHLLPLDSQESPRLQVLSRFMNRQKQAEELNQKKAKLHCFVLECSTLKDKPNYLAERHYVYSYLATHGLEKVRADDWELPKIKIDSGPDLVTQLEKEVFPLFRARSSRNPTKAVYVMPTSTGQIIHMMDSVVAGFRQLSEKNKLRHYSDVVLIIPFYTSDHNILVRWWIRQRIKSKLDCYGTLLPALTKLHEKDLMCISDNLPSRVKDKFDSLFYSINEASLHQVKENNGKFRFNWFLKPKLHYEQAEELLRNRIIERKSV